jgi:hypothetical protein
VYKFDAGLAKLLSFTDLVDLYIERDEPELVLDTCVKATFQQVTPISDPESLWISALYYLKGKNSEVLKKALDTLSSHNQIIKPTFVHKIIGDFAVEKRFLLQTIRDNR